MLEFVWSTYQTLDWAVLGKSVSAWIRVIDQRPWIEVWSKTPKIQHTMKEKGIESVYVPWSIPDPIIHERKVRREGPLRLLVNAGVGGYRKRRATDLVVRAFAVARSRETNLILQIKMIRRVSKYIPATLRRTKGLIIKQGFWTRTQLAQLHDWADAVVHVSRWEGFGLPVLEALHNGLPIIAVDGWPINELVVHEHNGLLVKATRVAEMRLAPHWEVDVDALSEAMIRLHRDRDLLNRMLKSAI